MNELLMKALSEAGVGEDIAKKVVSGFEKTVSAEGKSIILNDKKAPEFIPKARLDDEIAKKKNLQVQLDNSDATLKGLQETLKGNEEALGQIETLTKANAELEGKLHDTIFNQKLRSAIAEYDRKPHDIEDILKDINVSDLKETDNGILGLKDQLDALVSKKEYKFKPIEGGTGDTGRRSRGESGSDLSIGAELAKQRTIGNGDSIAEQRDSFFK